MLHWIRTLLDERSRDCLAVILPNGAVLAAVNLAGVSHLITIAGGLVTICYAGWRWRRDSYVLCRGCQNGRPPAVCPYPPHKRPPWCPRKI